MIGTKFFKLGNYKKALKVYSRINQYFRSKDARNNFQKENEDTLDFRNGKDELDSISKVILTNICVIHLKNKDYKEVVKFADDALAIDHKCVKALFLKGRAL